MSCTENDFVPRLEQSDIIQDIAYKEISLSQLVKNKTIRQKLQLSNNATQSIAESSDLTSLFIPLGNTKYMMQTEGIVKLQKGEITSYTIALYDTSKPLRWVNLMLTSSTKNKDVVMQMVSYDLSIEDRQKLQKGQKIDWGGKISIDKITNVMGYKNASVYPDGNGGCAQITYIPCQYHNHHNPGEGCPYAGKPGGPKTIITVLAQCPPGYGGNSGGGGDSGGGGLSGPAVPVYGAGGGAEGSDASDGITIPIKMKPGAAFYGHLSPDEQDFWENNPDIADKISEFLEAGGDAEFAFQALNVLMNDGELEWETLENLYYKVVQDPNLEFNFSNDTETVHEFNSYHDFVDNFSIENNDVVSTFPDTPENGSTKTAKFGIKYSSIINYQVVVSIEVERHENVWRFKSLSYSNEDISLGPQFKIFDKEVTYYVLNIPSIMEVKMHTGLIYGISIKGFSLSYTSHYYFAKLSMETGDIVTIGTF